MAFKVLEACPGVLHLQDEMGVCMTLLIGSSAALLVDAGYGLSNTAEQIGRLTDLPLTLLLTHAHHDHILGAWSFENALLAPPDIPFYPLYTDAAHRARVAGQAAAKGLSAAMLDSAVFPIPTPLRAGSIDLGGLTAQVLPCPGHTPGSVMIYIPERELLLTGDDWNPCTWLFFEEALDVWSYRSALREMLKLPFRWVLCSHQHQRYPRTTFETFVNGLTDACIQLAQPVPMPGRADMDIRQAEPAEGQLLVFDAKKAGLSPPV